MRSVEITASVSEGCHEMPITGCNTERVKAKETHKSGSKYGTKSVITSGANGAHIDEDSVWAWEPVSVKCVETVEVRWSWCDSWSD